MAAEKSTTRADLRFMNRFADVIRQLPEPGETWLSRETDIENIRSKLKALRIHGAIEKADRTYSTHSNEYINIWRTNPHLYQLAHTDAHMRQDTGILPCGHDAIKNERGVDGITCGVCGEIHDRSEVDA